MTKEEEWFVGQFSVAKRSLRSISISADVVVAATDLGAGRKITDKDITITSMSVSRLKRDM